MAAQFPDLLAAESTRHGGVSPAPFASLNLGLNTADNPAHVEINRTRFFQSFGIAPDRVASSHQVHGDEVLIATGPGRYSGYDALVTNERDLYLTVTVADCTPILLFDPVQKAVGAVHAGWRGTAADIALKTLRTMQEAFGTRPADCLAYIGTCIDECSFEVGPEVAEAFTEEHRRFDAAKNRFYVDLKAANRAQLIAGGLPEARIEVSPFSTVLHNAEYFSYRLEGGQTGRMLALIGLRSIPVP